MARVLLVKAGEKKKEFDFFNFAKYILSYDKLIDVHKEWCKDIDTSHKRKLYLKPRGTYKSTIYTVAYPIWKLLHDRNERILIANATSDNAESFVREITSQFTRNARLQSIVGNVLDPKTTRLANVTVKGRKTYHKEPSISTIGVLGNLVSAHYSTIICDDLCNHQDRDSSTIREKKKKWFQDLLSVLDPNGELIVVGCLDSDTNILMSDNTWKKITDVRRGEYVCSYKDGKLVSRKVEAMIPQGKSKVFELKTKNSTIIATGHHPFLIYENGTNPYFAHLETLEKGNFVVVNKLYSNTTVTEHSDDFEYKSYFKSLPFDKEFGLERIVSIKEIGEREVYDLSIDDTRNFIANGIVTHNTRWHYQDLYSYIIETLNEQLDDLEKYDIQIESCYEEDGITSRFPSILTEKDLSRLKLEKGPIEFNSQYINHPLPQESQIFFEEDFQLFEDLGADRILDNGLIKNVTNIGYCDLSMGKSNRADYTAIVTLGVAEDNTMYIMDVYMNRVPPDVTTNEIFDRHSKYDYKKFGIESNVFQSLFVDNMRQASMKNGMQLPIVEVGHTSNKSLRIQSIQPLIKQGIVKIKKNWQNDKYYKELINQLLYFPVYGHDDGPDALEGALSLNKKRKHGNIVPFFKSSVAEINVTNVDGFDMNKFIIEGAGDPSSQRMW